MSPEAITNRLKTMEQLWELSVNLVNAKEVSERNLTNHKFLEKSEIQKLKLKSRKIAKTS